MHSMSMAAESALLVNLNVLQKFLLLNICNLQVNNNSWPLDLASESGVGTLILCHFKESICLGIFCLEDDMPQR